MALTLKRASFLSALKLGSICYSKEVLHGVIRSQWRLHSSSSSEDDDFCQLGPPVSENGRTLTKLFTEKPEFFAAKEKFAASKKISTGTSSPAESIPTSNGLRIYEIFNGSRGKVKNGNGVPASKVRTGKVTVRICNVCQEKINRRFNKTVLDKFQWSAEVVLADTNVKTNHKNIDEQGDKCSSRDQITTGFDDLKSKFTTMKISSEDLEALHLALVELESHPETISG